MLSSCEGLSCTRHHLLVPLHGCTHMSSGMGALCMGIVVPVALTIGSDTQRGGGNLKSKSTERQLIVIQDL